MPLRFFKKKETTPVPNLQNIPLERRELLCENIQKLVLYGIKTGLTPKTENIYSTNLLLDVFGEIEFFPSKNNIESLPQYRLVLENILKDLLTEAVLRGLIQDTLPERDLFDTKIMNCLLPRPAQIQKLFSEIYQYSAEAATDFFYKFSQDSDYIRRYRINKDINWKRSTQYGELDITINLSKPEKDPKAIALALKSPSSSYPKCLLCMENEGYAGSLNHPARETLRIIPLTIQNKPWGFQYSPYVYYNEHCILLNSQHIPMKINRDTFVKLFDFIQQFPHYFIGSNADLPIVGGSILSHDHFQGGRYTFAMEKAESIFDFQVKGFEDVKASLIKWPLSVIRINGEEEKAVIDLGAYILEKWRGYQDEEAFIFSETNGEPHNTITPIARMRDGNYELDLVLRNNITTEEHPLGLYHPHENLHHIKKENIGLIEVMGLAVLPARLKSELELIKESLLNNLSVTDNQIIAKHAPWVEQIKESHREINSKNVAEILQEEVGKVFCQVLEDAGVYKQTEEGLEGFKRFVESLST